MTAQGPYTGMNDDIHLKINIILETPGDKVKNLQMMGWNTPIWNSSYTSIELSETH